ncbi:AraC family transcriptional regulator [Crossiella equi]|uniref:AraC family transcriptional regulator n=1 Tax=Crossiella equi TaxID=130796 RepID=A0ABS5A3Q7_9PSEU|nr:helix-turn-helix domain-containing protein [Crossiella equi]MBP2471209.1 AraC family transcriptional regulator [Crossiella equi]
MFDTADFDLAPYAGLDVSASVRHTYRSWQDSGWRSLLVQCFEHAPEVEALPMPGVADLHLVLCVAGDVDLRTSDRGRRRWVPGSLDLLVPGRATERGYRSRSPLRTVQVHIPSATVRATAAQLGGAEPDFEALSAAVAAGDPLVEHLVRALPAARGADDLYAETAAAFLTTHLLNARPPASGPEHAAVRAATALMRERLAEPLTLAVLAAEVHLSAYHFIRVFRDATGVTPHRYLAGLRIEHARRLLTSSTLTLEQIAARCGFASPGALSTAFHRQLGVRPSAYRNN